MKTKKILAILITVFMLTSIFPLGVLAADNYVTEDWTYPSVTPTLTWGGSGTEQDPYTIDTPQELADLAYMVNSSEADTLYANTYFKLTADIDLNPSFKATADEFTGEGTPKQWVPIGDVRADDDVMVPFCGIFDGDGHTIKGMYIADETCARDVVGLFGYTDTFDENSAPSSVKNLNMTNCYIYSDAAYNLGYECTALGTVVAMNLGIVDNCHVTETYLTLDNPNYGYFMGIGGIVSDNYAVSSEVTNCSFDGEIEYMGSYSPNMGGIAGSNSGYVANCINYADVVAETDRVGGIVGTNRGEALDEGYKHGVIESCVNYGDITGQYKVGGIAGHSSWKSDSTNNGTAIIDCTNYGDVTANRVVSDDGDNLSELKGEFEAGGIVGLGYDVEIDGCVNYGNVITEVKITGDNIIDTVNVYMGGIIGDSAQTVIKDSYNHGELVVMDETPNYSLGAIAGSLKDTYTVENCGYAQSRTVNNGLSIIALVDDAATGTVTGTKVFAPFDSITIGQSVTELEKGKSLTLTVIADFGTAIEQGVIWESSDNTVATVDDDGVVTAVAEGNTTITASVFGKTLTWKVKVVPAVADLSDAYINDDGNLILDLSDGEKLDLGSVVGDAGTDGEDGANGNNGADGKDGSDAQASNGLVIVSLIIAIVALIGNAVVIVLYVMKNKKTV